ncbi:flagellar basal body-associated FliL family protein [Hyphococcus lacteus]|uniref:Flagellar protein FliL n=1 Tax=Hyphococcus lacteus TaxID=3143536 RepID=A0ABV3Z930_9PROT
MSDAKKTNADADAPAENEDGEADVKSKGLGLIPMIIGAVAAAGVAGGAAFVLAPSGSTNPEHAEQSADGDHVTDDHGEKKTDHGDDKKKKKKKKASKGHGDDKGDGGESAVKPIGKIQHHDYATFLVLEPMVVSIQPIGRSKHVKISLVLETDDDGAEVMLDHGFYIQDVLNTFLRSVDSSVLEDPASMSRLRAQILRRVRAIVPDATLNNVLITEFVLT